jgi:signal transduction histidine kinase
VRDVKVSDVALGVGFAVVVLVAGITRIGPAGPGGTVDLGAVALVAAVAVALSVRRRWPFTALLAIDAITLGWYVLAYPGRLITVGALIANYTVAAQRGWRWGALGGLVSIATSVLTIRHTLNGGWFDDRAVNAASLEIAAVAFGVAVHYHRAYAANARERADRMAEARAETARRQAAEERLRIARELHDAFGHTMAAVSVQAGVAVHVMRRRPEQAAAALTTIKRVSDEGLTEVRTLLAILRGDDLEHPARALDQLESLLDLVRAEGVRAELTVRGERRTLPATVDLAAFRIVQESLTNVRKHAKAQAVEIVVRYDVDRIEMTITDDGAGGAASGPEPGGGHGIDGMRARAAALGGQLTAAPADRGFRVRCVLPTEGQE